MEPIVEEIRDSEENHITENDDKVYEDDDYRLENLHYNSSKNATVNQFANQFFHLLRRYVFWLNCNKEYNLWTISSYLGILDKRTFNNKWPNIETVSLAHEKDMGTSVCQTFNARVEWFSFKIIRKREKEYGGNRLKQGTRYISLHVFYNY
jgi:hypothetical protein